MEGLDMSVVKDKQNMSKIVAERKFQNNRNKMGFVMRQRIASKVAHQNPKTNFITRRGISQRLGVFTTMQDA